MSFMSFMSGTFEQPTPWSTQHDIAENALRVVLDLLADLVGRPVVAGRHRDRQQCIERGNPLAAVLGLPREDVDLMVMRRVQRRRRWRRHPGGVGAGLWVANLLLAPTLRRGDVVALLDNLPAHKVSDVLEAITERRAHIFYLPPYSPDMNPIEMAFAKLKALLRQEPAPTIDGLFERIGQLLERFLPTECGNYFQAAGYVPTVIMKML